MKVVALCPELTPTIVARSYVTPEILNEIVCESILAAAGPSSSSSCRHARKCDSVRHNIL